MFGELACASFHVGISSKFEDFSDVSGVTALMTLFLTTKTARVIVVATRPTVIRRMPICIQKSALLSRLVVDSIASDEFVVAKMVLVVFMVPPEIDA